MSKTTKRTVVDTTGKVLAFTNDQDLIARLFSESNTDANIGAFIGRVNIAEVDNINTVEIPEAVRKALVKYLHEGIGLINTAFGTNDVVVTEAYSKDYQDHSSVSPSVWKAHVVAYYNLSGKTEKENFEYRRAIIQLLQSVPSLIPHDPFYLRRAAPNQKFFTDVTCSHQPSVADSIPQDLMDKASQHLDELCKLGYTVRNRLPRGDINAIVGSLVIFHFLLVQKAGVDHEYVTYRIAKCRQRGSGEWLTNRVMLIPLTDYMSEHAGGVDSYTAGAQAISLRSLSKRISRGSVIFLMKNPQ